MATILQQQLAAIAANSTHQLDLKAQKQRHSKSLLFSPREASAQSFDTIFQVCFEGFQEICALDSRFTPFARNLFSEQSKDEDRTQMTSVQNEELDNAVKSFMTLISGRILLRPALKAIEWLVRRFRIQEYNTEVVLLTFLPYHSDEVFPILMSILPERLPPAFRWLHPYVASLTCIPRHAILQAAISNHAFFSLFNSYTLEAARVHHHSAILLGFWASLTAQAVNGMIDATRSGRDAIRQQREEDVLLRVLPHLQLALNISEVQELYLGVCMIIAIIATKTSLQDRALDALMEAVVGGWEDETLDEGLTCLILLAEAKEGLYQPASITETLLESEHIVKALLRLSNVQKSIKLLSATAIGCLGNAPTALTPNVTTFVVAVLDQDVLPRTYRLRIFEDLLRLWSEPEPTVPHAAWPVSRTSHLKSEELYNVIRALAENEAHSSLLEEAALAAAVSLSPFILAVPGARDNDMVDYHSSAAMVSSPGDVDDHSEYEAQLQALPAAKGMRSFFASTEDHDFRKYLDALASANTQSRLNRFRTLHQLRHDQIVQCPEWLTFFARAWTSDSSSIVKTRALGMARTELLSVEDAVCIDCQPLYPYLLTALADLAPTIRKYTADICRIIISKYDDNAKRNARLCPEPTLYESSVFLLTSQDSHKFLASVLLPILEDCVIDKEYLSRALPSILRHGTIDQSGSDRRSLSKTLRADICHYLATHVVATPSMRVKLCLLKILNRSGKPAEHAVTTTVLPFVKHWCSDSNDHLQELCAKDGVKLEDMDRAIIQSLTLRKDELHHLQALVLGKCREQMVSHAFERLRHLWSAAKPVEIKVELASFLMDVALERGTKAQTQCNQRELALDVLRTVDLPGEVLIGLIAGLSTPITARDQPPSAKKRRTSSIDEVRSTASAVDLKSGINQMTVVLELVEMNKPEKHPQLLKSLFHVLNELRQYKSLMNSELTYLDISILSCLLAVVNGVKQNPDASSLVDPGVIRTDLIIESVRATSSTQVHNAALLLVSAIASWSPAAEKVLHCVMPLFTFMSTTLLRRSDEYSAHVTETAVAKIVPALAASLKRKGKDVVTGAVELLFSFTAAYEHIPLQRRLPLFVQLVQILGAGETLSAVTAMLLERYSAESDRGAIIKFVDALTNAFPASTGLRAGTQYLDLMFDALKPKRDLSNVLLGFSDRDAVEVRTSLESLLADFATLLQSQTLRSSLQESLLDAREDVHEAQQIRSTYASLLEKAMQLARNLASDDGLATASGSILASTLGLMPVAEFIASSAQLMQTGSSETRQQVFQSLEARVEEARRTDKVAAQTFIDVLPNCLLFVSDDHAVAVRRAAVSCVDRICEKFGKTQRDAVIEAAIVIASEAALGSDDGKLRVLAVLSLADMVDVLREDMVQILPGVLGTVVDLLRTGITESAIADVSTKNAAMGMINAVLDSLPWMITSKILDEVLTILGHDAQIEPGLTQGSPVGDFIHLAAKTIPAPDLFAALQRTWTKTSILGSSAAQRNLNVLQNAVSHHTKTVVNKNAHVVFDLLLCAFDLRRQLPDADSVVDLTNKIALDMTLKLNDVTFRPLYARLVDWASEVVEGRTARLLGLFSFSLLLFDQLKSIVTSYARFLLDVIPAVLRQPMIADTAERVLLDLILQTLSVSFQNDQDDFWQSSTHFEAVASPLIDQLKQAQTRSLNEFVIPAITDLVISAASPDHHKVLNNQIMGLMRDHSASVRLAAVSCERSITQQVKLDWLALLPEMLPFISELQEDDDPRVEQETLRWITEIETVTGESLEGMLA